MNRNFFLRMTYFAGFLFSFHVALTVYSNSSFLATRVSADMVGWLYTASALLAMVGLFLVPRLVTRFGTRPVLGLLVLLNIGNLLGMTLSGNTGIIAACFVLFFAFNTLLYLGLDILIEEWSEAGVQGRVRGTYLTANNIGFMVAPFLGGLIIDRIGYGMLYGFAIALLVPVFAIVAFVLPNRTSPHPSKSNFFALVRKFLRNRSLGSVFIVNFILQFFYAWMVIYTPIYLHVNAGIPWDTIGITFTIMLSAFVLFQYATGKLADRFHFEKGMIMFGLLVMGISTFFVTQAPVLTFWALAGVLFVTRIGASIVEVMTESYFFKHVHHDDTGSIGFFRNTYPFAYVLAPVVAAVVLKVAPIGALFGVLGVLCLAGIVMAFNIKKRA